MINLCQISITMKADKVTTIITIIKYNLTRRKNKNLVIKKLRNTNKIPYKNKY
jgi:hypothetical protein